MDAWSLTVNALYIIVVLLFVVILYFVLRDESFLYKTKMRGALKVFKKGAARVTHELSLRDKVLDRIYSMDVHIDDHDNIAVSPERLAGYLCFLFGSEHTTNAFSEIIKFIHDMSASADNFNVAYNIIAILLHKRDFAMSAEVSDDSMAILQGCLELVKKDQSTRNYKTVIAYLATKQFGIDIDFNTEFLEACQNVGNVSIIQQSETNTDSNKTMVYPSGIIASSTMDDGAALAELLPLLYIINQYQDFIALDDYTNIIPSHKIIAKGFKMHFMQNSSLIDPNISSISKSKYLNLSLALLVHSIYDIFNAEELSRIVDRINVVEENHAEEAPMYVKYPLGHSVYPDTVSAAEGIEVPRFELESRLNYMKTNDFMGFSVRSQDKDTEWPISVDVNGDQQSTTAFHLNNEAAAWDTANCVMNVNDVGGWLVGCVKMGGGNIAAQGSQDIYFVSKSDELCILNLFSNVSFSNTKDEINYEVLSFQSTDVPQIVTPKNKLHILNSESYKYSIDEDTPIQFSYSSKNAAAGEPSTGFMMRCSEIVYVECSADNAGGFWTKITATTMHSIQVKKESATSAYPYISISFTRLCETFPVKLPKLYFAPYNRERNVLRYNDYFGTNKIDIYTQSVNKTVLSNITVSPALTLDERNYILIADLRTLFGSAVAFFDAQKLSVKSIVGRPAVVNSYGIGEAKNIKVVIK